ncbi:PiggyBac transposable element-derived protein 4 [Dictyocoela muelleri]|nr:PiggyBac transposable element-derived protein 4 [Dictyocoela muelleri]
MTIFMGIFKLPEIRMYWGKDPRLARFMASEKISYKKFTYINKFFSLTKTNNDENDKVTYEEMTKKILDHLNNKFKRVYIPEEKICVDEGVIKAQSRYKFKCYFPNKPTKVGMKMYLLCESKSSYVLGLNLYTGMKT